MTTIHTRVRTAEPWVISRVDVDGDDTVEILVDGTPATFCGHCGRLIHHPDCPTGRGGSTNPPTTPPDRRVSRCKGNGFS